MKNKKKIREGSKVVCERKPRPNRNSPCAGKCRHEWCKGYGDGYADGMSDANSDSLPPR